ncbi:phage tail protein [Escherichia coli]|uniref:phage tail protein n=2 Tax=Escherichia TaxID=561 RepID=UPI00267831FD|nr:phage tail fiber [Escherichia sp. HH091_1A]
MHRIDTLTAVKDKFGPGKNGFTDGNLRTGRLATWLNSAMWDAIQEEICGVIEKAGIELNKKEHDQLYKAILLLVGGAINEEALLIKNNLSDVEDKDEAVENLGLKHTVDKAKNAVQRDGDTMTGKLILPQTSAFGVNTENILGGNSLAIGEGQTGLKQVSGTLSIFVQGNEVFYLEEDTITAMVDILLNGYLSADKVMVASSSGGWIDMRNQSVFLGRNPVSTNSAQALLRQDHADRKYFLGGLGNKQFGIYMINNSRSDNGTDGQAYMDESGNWLCGRQIIPSDYGNFDSRYAKTGASITSVRLG